MLSGYQAITYHTVHTLSYRVQRYDTDDTEIQRYRDTEVQRYRGTEV